MHTIKPLDTEAVTKVLKKCKGVVTVEDHNIINGLGSAVYTVVRYIDQHYKEITDIRDVAKELGYSYTYLAHVFKDKMDMTIGTYIIHKKMEEAKELLRTGRMNVSQVAERLNYMSVQSFSNSFKKVNGISPAEFISGRQKRPNA